MSVLDFTWNRKIDYMHINSTLHIQGCRLSEPK